MKTAENSLSIFASYSFEILCGGGETENENTAVHVVLCYEFLTKQQSVTVSIDFQNISNAE